MKLTQEEVIASGKYMAVVRAAVGGQVKLQISVDSKPAIDITGATWTESATAIIELPACKLIPVITGDADVSISPVDND